jgi:hypothetical protein
MINHDSMHRTHHTPIRLGWVAAEPCGIAVEEQEEIPHLMGILSRQMRNLAGEYDTYLCFASYSFQSDEMP